MYIHFFYQDLSCLELTGKKLTKKRKKKFFDQFTLFVQFSLYIDFPHEPQLSHCPQQTENSSEALVLQILPILCCVFNCALDGTVALNTS